MADPPFVHATAEIDSGATIGSGTSVWANTHVRSTAVIGAGCTIGEHAYVDADVTIGDRVKIQNQAMIFGPAQIGDGCFVGPGACLTNDRRPRAVSIDGTVKRVEDWDAAGVTVAEGASIGAQATIISGVSIGEWALVAAGAVVTHNVAPYTVVVGVPAREQGYVCRCALPLDDTLRCSDGHRYHHSGDTLRLIAE